MSPTPANIAALVAALGRMKALASSGAVRAHLDGAGIMQDPPHSMGRYIDCPAPWCVRNRESIAAALALLPERSA